MNSCTSSGVPRKTQIYSQASQFTGAKRLVRAPAEMMPTSSASAKEMSDSGMVTATVEVSSCGSDSAQRLR